MTSYSVGGAIGRRSAACCSSTFWGGSVFLLGVPVMVLLLIVGPRLLRKYRDPNAQPIDITSAVLSLSSVLLVIYGLKRIAEDGVGMRAVVSVVLGVVVGIVFVRRQRKLTHPHIELQLFRSVTFSVALVTYMLATFAAFGAFVFIAQYFQLVLGLSPLQAGMWSLPSFLTFVAGSMLVPVLARRFGLHS